MEFLLFVGMVIIIAILLHSKNRLEDKISVLISRIDKLQSLFEDLPEIKKPQQSPIVRETPKDIIVPEVKAQEPVIREIPSIKVEQPAPRAIPVSRPIERPAPKPKVKQPSFFERYPDLEKFIGENLINKIGIGILVLGIGFFVKFAIDQDWINEIGRVFIGILCGGILVGLAHRMRNNFKAFSSVLVGGGLAIFYLTIALAFHEYQLFTQTAAFIIMVIITAFAILLSITYDRKELAVLAIIGGFGSPFMLSTGEGNYVVLFSYILILNVGMLILAYFKKWNIINIICYAFTILIYGGWLATKVYDQENAPLMGAFIFGTIFYLVFFLMNIINNVRENRRFEAIEVSILLSNTFLYYAAGSLILHSVQDGIYKGLFTLLIAVFNFTFAYTLYKKKKVDSNLVYMLIGLVLTFISLAAPVQLKGNQITLFWAAEAVLLLWLSQKSGIMLIKLSSVIVMGLMFVSLVMDWQQIYSNYEPLTIVLNKVYVTSIVSLASIALTIFLLKKEDEKFLYSFGKKEYGIVLQVAFTGFLYVSQLLELNHQLDTYIDPYSFKSIIIGSYNLFFLAGIIFYLSKQTQTLRIASSIIGIGGCIAYITYYQDEIIRLRYDYLVQNYASLGNFCYHGILVVLVGVILFLTSKITFSVFGRKSSIGKLYLWFLSFAIVYIASAELDHIVLLSTYTDEDSIYSIISQNHKIGFPILWGICSFIFITIGMRNKIKELRIISLSLFLIILIKLFLFDIRGISEGGKIAAFICLGILLLVISFMYQKLKKLFVEDEAKPELV